MFEYSHADGIIVIGDFEGGDSTLDVLVEQHRFVVGVTDRTARRKIPGVYADSAAGTRLAMDHLWDLGHRAITCVSDDRTADGRLRIERYGSYLQRTRCRRPHPGLRHRPGAGAELRPRAGRSSHRTPGSRPRSTPRPTPRPSD